MSEQPVEIRRRDCGRCKSAWAGVATARSRSTLRDPPEGITAERASWTERGLALVLHGDAARAKPKLKGNLMANAFLQTTATEKDGKTREVRNFIGPLPALPFEIVKP